MSNDVAPSWCSPLDEYHFSHHRCRLLNQDESDTPGSLRISSQALHFLPDEDANVMWSLPLSKVESASCKQVNVAVVMPGESSSYNVLALNCTERVIICNHPVQPYIHHKQALQLQFGDFPSSDNLIEIATLIQQLQGIVEIADRGGAKQKAESAAQLQALQREHLALQAFDPESLSLPLHESILTHTLACQLTPLNKRYGWAVVTPSRVCFAPLFGGAAPHIQLSEVVHIGHRRCELEDVGLEFIVDTSSSLRSQSKKASGRKKSSISQLAPEEIASIDNNNDVVIREESGNIDQQQKQQQLQSTTTSLHFMFPSSTQRKLFERVVLDQKNVLTSLDTWSSSKWTRHWVKGHVSNYDYLLHLNRLAGRSFNDLSQYPIFPWVLTEYSNTVLNLEDSRVFRDLSRPIAALDPTRLDHGRTVFESLMAQARGQGRGSFLNEPAWMWGSHYSNPGGVVFYLVRSDPKLMLRLQGGRFDAADRIFFSVADAWKSVVRWGSDVKELIPQFYDPTQPDFLIAPDSVDLGVRQNGSVVGDVELPAWAEGSARKFLKLHRAALESRHVTAHLNEWIDLVFGVKSRGKGAEMADNVFYYTTYDEIVSDLMKKETDPAIFQSYRTQVREYGRTPRQLFKKAHPSPQPQPLLKRLLAACVCGGFAPPGTVSAGDGDQVVQVLSQAVNKENDVPVGDRNKEVGTFNGTENSSPCDAMAVNNAKQLEEQNTEDSNHIVEEESYVSFESANEVENEEEQR